MCTADLFCLLEAVWRLRKHDASLSADHANIGKHEKTSNAV